VILEGDEVEPRPLGQLRKRDDLLGPLVQRRDESAKGELVSVVSRRLLAAVIKDRYALCSEERGAAAAIPRASGLPAQGSCCSSGGTSAFEIGGGLRRTS
jgi:hypothetical protein